MMDAVEAPWPDIHPDPMDLFTGLATTAGVSSYTSFVARSAYAAVARAGWRFGVEPENLEW